MKIKSLRINNFRKFVSKEKPFEFSFYDSEFEEFNKLTLITGDNGSGKSSILQAIYLILGSVVFPDSKPSQLTWPGLNFKYLQNGVLPPLIELELYFSDDEIDAIEEFIIELNSRFESGNKLKIPYRQNIISLFFDYNSDNVIISNGHPDLINLVFGYIFASVLSKNDDRSEFRMQRIGSFYAYNESRTTTSLNNYFLKNGESDYLEFSSYEKIKEVISRWYYFHLDRITNKFELRPGQFDKFEKLKTLYESIFIGRKLENATLSKGGGNDIDVVFNDGQNRYDLTELSGGERAILPILIEFSNLNINNSIILIDELELHLHPPLQSHLLNALEKLPGNNQFIFTSHSSVIINQVPDKFRIKL